MFCIHFDVPEFKYAIAARHFFLGAQKLTRARHENHFIFFYFGLRDIYCVE